MTRLTVGEFAAFFRAVHGQTPFPWQARLLAQVAAEGCWRELLDLPTGSGKTAAIDVAVFHLALEAEAGSSRRAALRIAFVVDRRLIVDDAFARATKLARALSEPQHEIVARVAARLRALAGGDGKPLVACRLRGGVPREEDWARTPCQPTVLCSTVDQVGSRLLFRGYGVSESMAPVHAGLLGSDCLILLDEAHLAQPFRQTAQAIGAVRSLHGGDARPVQVALLSATAEAGAPPFGLADDDWADPVLGPRLRVSKVAKLQAIEGHRHTCLAEAAIAVVGDLRVSGIAAPAVAVVVNRVARARAVFAALCAAEAAQGWRVDLIVGAARGVDRAHAEESLAPIRTGAARELSAPQVLVATQTIEAGVDIDLDGLISEAAALDALRQRFGRLNRGARAIAPRAVVFAREREDLRGEDPVYGLAIGLTWTALGGTGAHVDFGIEAMSKRLRAFAADGGVVDALTAPRRNAPVLMPAYVALWSQTAPVPLCDPEVSLFLHGPDRDPDLVQVLWRADVTKADLDPDAGDADARARRARWVAELLALAPPLAGEVIELPVWAVRDWLERSATSEERLADVAVAAASEEKTAPSRPRRAFRWAGTDSPRTCIVRPRDVRPGDVIVVPASEGGCDRYGWKPGHDPDREGWTNDVRDDAASVAATSRVVVRVHRGLIRQALLAQAQDPGEAVLTKATDKKARELELRIAEALDDLGEQVGAKRVADRLLAIGLPEPLTTLLERVPAKRAERPAFPYIDDGGRRVGAVLTWRTAAGGNSSTEDDETGSFRGRRDKLSEHTAAVCAAADRFAARAGLDASVRADITLAARLHDVGKADRRFQALLAGGDPLATLDDNVVLAKSDLGRAPRGTWERVGLPPRWRHEALSVRLALADPRLSEAHDPALVAWLIGTHHGHGRPFFPHGDPADDEPRVLATVDGGLCTLPAGPGPQRLGLRWRERPSRQRVPPDSIGRRCFQCCGRATAPGGWRGWRRRCGLPTTVPRRMRVTARRASRNHERDAASACRAGAGQSVGISRAVGPVARARAGSARLASAGLLGGGGGAAAASTRAEQRGDAGGRGSGSGGGRAHARGGA